MRSVKNKRENWIKTKCLHPKFSNVYTQIVLERQKQNKKTNKPQYIQVWLTGYKFPPHYSGMLCKCSVWEKFSSWVYSRFMGTFHTLQLLLHVSDLRRGLIKSGTNKSGSIKKFLLRIHVTPHTKTLLSQLES